MTEQQRRTQAVLLVVEDDLRGRIVEAAPEIRHDVQIMADMIREMVEQQRLEKGYLSIEFDLYWDPKETGRCLAETRIGKKLYQILGEPARDSKGRKVLKIRMRPESRSHV